MTKNGRRVTFIATMALHATIVQCQFVQTPTITACAMAHRAEGADTVTRISFAALQIPQLQVQLAGIMQAVNIVFQTPIVYWLYNDVDGGDAIALPANAHRPDEILVGARLLTDDIRDFIVRQVNSPTYQEYGTAAIFAHEAAHIVQSHLPAAWLPDSSVRTCELQADFMSGWFTGTTNYFGQAERQRVEDGADAFFKRGSEHSEADSHGTDMEREAAFREGARAAGQPLLDAFRAGANWVKNHPPAP